MQELTVDQFNEQFGVTTYGHPRYKIASGEDIGTFVGMFPDGQTIPYFCEWKQSTDETTILDNRLLVNKTKIIEG